MSRLQREDFDLRPNLWIECALASAQVAACSGGTAMLAIIAACGIGKGAAVVHPEPRLATGEVIRAEVFALAAGYIVLLGSRVGEDLQEGLDGACRWFAGICLVVTAVTLGAAVLLVRTADGIWQWAAGVLATLQLATCAIFLTGRTIGTSFASC